MSTTLKIDEELSTDEACVVFEKRTMRVDGGTDTTSYNCVTKEVEWYVDEGHPSLFSYASDTYYVARKQDDIGGFRARPYVWIWYNPKDRYYYALPDARYGTNMMGPWKKKKEAFDFLRNWGSFLKERGEE